MASVSLKCVSLRWFHMFLLWFLEMWSTLLGIRRSGLGRCVFALLSLIPAPMEKHSLESISHLLGNCYYWIYLRWYSSRSHPRNRFNLRHWFVQTRRWPHLRGYHHQQESLGIRFQQVHHAMDHLRRLYPSHHVEHEPHNTLVLVRPSILVLRQDFQEVDKERQGSLLVIRELSFRDTRLLQSVVICFICLRTST